MKWPSPNRMQRISTCVQRGSVQRNASTRHTRSGVRYAPLIEDGSGEAFAHSDASARIAMRVMDRIAVLPMVAASARGSRGSGIEGGEGRP